MNIIYPDSIVAIGSTNSAVLFAKNIDQFINCTFMGIYIGNLFTLNKNVLDPYSNVENMLGFDYIIKVSDSTDIIMYINNPNNTRRI